jgi:hypothetical protein
MEHDELDKTAGIVSIGLLGVVFLFTLLDSFLN